MKRRAWFVVVVAAMLLTALAVAAVKTLVIAPRTVSDTAGILDIYYETRSGLPPLPPPISYKTVAEQISQDRFDFLASPDWAFNHSGGTLYLSEKSKLNLSLPMVLTAYEDLASGKVVLTGSTADSKKIETLTVVDAPDFAEKKSEQTVESWLLKEIGPRRIIWTAVLKSEEEAWADLLSVQEESLVEPMMMSMSVPETITGFRIIQDGTNLSVNLPVEFAGATVSLKQSTNLIEGVWNTVLQTNVMSTGVVFLAYADIPDLVINYTTSTNSTSCSEHTIPDPSCTNCTFGVTTNQTSQSGGLVYYRTAASSTVDSDSDGLDNVSEYDLGTDYLLADSSGDGLLDGWAVTNDFNPLSLNTLGDSDNDGYSNLEEQKRGTDPDSPDSSGSTGTVATIRYYYDEDDRLTDFYCGSEVAERLTPGNSHNLYEEVSAK